MRLFLCHPQLGPVAGIRDDRPHRLIGNIFMRLNESKQTNTFVDCSGRSLYGGDNLMGVIDHSMAFIAATP